VLSCFDEVKIGAKYIDSTTGLECVGMPASLSTYANVTVEWVTMPGWGEDISQCRTFAALPAKCQDYVRKVEELLGGHKVRWIGVGAGRDALIDCLEPTAV
jgi:adenylosuccinate synthase